MKILMPALVALFCFTSCSDSKDPANSQSQNIENSIDKDLEDLINEDSYTPELINQNNNHTGANPLPKCPARTDDSLVLPTKVPKPPYKEITNERYIWQWHLGNLNNHFQTNL